MLLSFSIIFLFGLLFGALFEKIRLPKIIAMLAVGVIIGPFVLGWIDESVLNISADIRKIALIIILIKAGLTLNLKDLKKVGRPAILLSFLPASFEILAYAFIAPLFFEINHYEAALMGAVLSAVSPAVVVPRMVKFIEEKKGTKKGIPQMILAGASLDDVFVITIFGAFCAMVQGGSVSAKDFLGIPVSIILGILLGVLCGFVLGEAFLISEKAIKQDTPFRVVIILAVAFLMVAVESFLDGIVPVSSLLGVIAMACTCKIVMLKKNEEKKADCNKLSSAFGKIWLPAECLLFVLVGAAVDIKYTVSAGPGAVAIIFIALFIRSIGVLLSLIKTGLTAKEKLFCVVSYLPKATVQAAIGSVPLGLGLGCGNIILSVAVLGILITAPLGAFGIDFLERRKYIN